MATFSSDKPVEEEKEMQTEEADPAITTEEEEVRTEEDELREEASESLLDFDSINSRLSLIMDDEESNKGAESQKPQEESTMMQRREQTMERGSTSSSCDQNRPLAPQNRSTAQMSKVMMPLEEQIPRSDQTVNRGSTTFSTDQNRLLTPQVMIPIEEQVYCLLSLFCSVSCSAINVGTNVPKLNQMQRNDQTLERGLDSFARDQNRRLVPPNSSGVQLMMPLEEQIPRDDHQTVNHGSTTFSSDSLETKSPFQQQQRSTTAHILSLGTQQQLFPTMMTTQKPGWFIRDHSSASAWRPQILMPSVDHQQHPMANQLANIVGLQNQTFVPRPLFTPDQTCFVEQPHLNAIASSMYRYYPYMRPEANHLNLRMPHFRSDLMFTLTSPSGQPRSFVLLQDQFNPHQRFVLSLDDALVYGPLLEIDHPQPQKRQLLDFPIDMIHRHASLNGPRPQQNHQQMQQRFNQGQHIGFPIDHHQASPNAAAAAAAPRPELNHQQMQQLQPQMQYPTQTQRFNDGLSSQQGQHQQQP
ncbi:hypothetical protein HA466_0143660 [Hirschfeldia incana]|nr:hypothetical protein HA466_0143660 [Hirschfeldia incana]